MVLVSRNPLLSDFEREWRLPDPQRKVDDAPWERIAWSSSFCHWLRAAVSAFHDRMSAIDPKWTLDHFVDD